MEETVDAVDAAPAEDEDADAQPSLSELLEELGGELNALVFAESRLAAARHRPALLRAGRDAAAAIVAVVAFVTAFALANQSVVRALSPTLPGWAAPLVVAAVWVVVGVLLVLYLAARFNRVTGWSLRSAEEAREDARQSIRETLERLAPVITREIAAAAVPTASVVVDVGEDLIEDADEMMESMTAELPGGGVVNQMWDVVLMPGRFGIRVATTGSNRGRR